MDRVGTMPTADAALVLYARTPRSGTVKTRMVPWLSPDEALRLHEALLIDSLELLRLGARSTRAVPFVAFSEDWEPEGQPGCEDLARTASGVIRRPQSGVGLGERLHETFHGLLAGGFRRVVVIGCDSPTLPPDFLRMAFDALRDEREAVLAPAADGGFVLLGLTNLRPGMLEGIPWGTGGVTKAILAQMGNLGVSVAVLPGWHDIDLPQDLESAAFDLSIRESGDFVPRLTRAFIEELRREGRLPVSPRG